MTSSPHPLTSLQFDYLQLVVKTVRGLTPIPEFVLVEENRSVLAQAHFDHMRNLFPNGESGSPLLDMILAMGSGFLELSWEKMSPPALTMCGEQSVSHLLEVLNTIESENIEGDFIETGVWRGGLPIVMRAFLKAIGDTERKVWAADSYCGLPDFFEDSNDRGAHLILEPLKHLSVSRLQVEAAFSFFDLLDAQVELVEGWFNESLQTVAAASFSLIRLDGDYYESTRDALASLYSKLSPGGFLIVDDYNLPLGCKRAVDEFRSHNQITEPLREINNQAVYWRKSRAV